MIADNLKYYGFIDAIKHNKIASIGLILLLILVYNSLTLINISLGFTFLAVFIAILTLICIYNNPMYAAILYLWCTFLMFFIFYRVFHIRGVPWGILLDSLNAFTLLILLLKRKLKGHKELFGIFLIVWFAICFVQVGNPLAASRAAWFHAMRITFNGVVPFFIMYSLFKMGKNPLRIVLISWIVLSTFSALYTFYQEFVGLPPWDFKYLHENDNRVFLFYTWGRLRKFSFLGNPTENGLILCVNTILCFGLAFGQKIKFSKKILLLILGVFSAMAMIYTGTRTASVLFVIGFGLYVLVSRNKFLWIASVFIFVLLTAYVVKTGGGAALSVMSTAFDEDDPSLQVRYHNQKMLQSYLYKSPIGYGLGSNGFLGGRYSPNTFLGGFQPDSELVRLIIEVGFLGVAFYLYMYYRFIKRSSELLYHKTDKVTYNLRLIITVLLFTILLGHYPQQIMYINAFKVLVGTLVAYICLDPEESDKLTFNF